jgi:hypothetical protein
MVTIDTVAPLHGNHTANERGIHGNLEVFDENRFKGEGLSRTPRYPGGNFAMDTMLIGSVAPLRDESPTSAFSCSAHFCLTCLAYPWLPALPAMSSSNGWAYPLYESSASSSSEGEEDPIDMASSAASDEEEDPIDMAISAASEEENQRSLETKDQENKDKDEPFSSSDAKRRRTELERLEGHRAEEPVMDSEASALAARLAQADAVLRPYSQPEPGQQQDLREHLDFKPPEHAAAATDGGGEATELVGATIDGAAVKVFGHAPVWIPGGSVAELAPIYVQEVKGSTAEKPCNGTKALPWLVVTLQWPLETVADSAKGIYDRLADGIGESALHFGVCRVDEHRALVLVRKSKGRNLTLPELSGCSVKVQSVAFPKNQGAVQTRK